MTQPYQEENSTFRDGDETFNLNLIWKAVNNQPLQYISVDKLRWVVQPDDHIDQERVDKTDLTAPLLVTYRNGRELAVDGYHRLVKAIQTGVGTLPYQRVSPAIMRRALIEPEKSPEFTRW